MATGTAKIDHDLTSNPIRRYKRSVNAIIGYLAITACSISLLPLASLAEHSPQRIVSVVPALTEALFALGAKNQIVGVGSFDTVPTDSASLPRVGGLLDPDLEQILSLQPDLVVLYSSQSDLIEQLARAGISTFTYIHGGLADSLSTLRTLGTTVGKGNEAQQLVDSITSELNILKVFLGGRPKPRALLVFGREPGSLRNIYASGGVGFLHHMLEAAGGLNILTHVPRESIQLTSEAILAGAPEVIIELTYANRVNSDNQSAQHSAWNQLSAIPAVRNQRVHLLLGAHFLQPGPRLAEATTAIAQALHPDIWP